MWDREQKISTPNKCSCCGTKSKNSEIGNLEILRRPNKAWFFLKDNTTEKIDALTKIVTKDTLEMLLFHFTQKRIEVHVCICFVAYKVYKELERILKLSGINLSVDKVLNIAKTVTTLKSKLPESGKTLTKIMLLTATHKMTNPLFDKKFWKMF